MIPKEPLRILMVSEPGAYGVFLNVRMFIRFLHAHHPEISVDLAYSSRRSWPDTAVLADEVRARGGEAIDLNVGNSPELRDLPALVRLLRLVRRRAPQLIHAHSSKAGGLCRLLSLTPGFPPILYAPHAYFGMARNGGKKEWFFNSVESLLGRLGHTHVVSGDERRFALEVLKIPQRSLVLINNGILTDQFVPATAAQRAGARAQLGIPQAGKLLVTVGRDSSQKNYGPLYRALNRFLRDHPSVHFAHAGGGSVARRAQLDAPLRDRCHCVEFMADVRELLWAADGFILTSLYEGLSISMLEAASCGLPLILTDAPGIAGMRAFGLQIDWLPNPRQCPDFEGALLKTLLIWSQRPAGVALNQHYLARRNFNIHIQYVKVIRLYRWLVART